VNKRRKQDRVKKELEQYLPKGWKTVTITQKELTKRAKGRLTPGMGEPIVSTSFGDKTIYFSDELGEEYTEDLLAHEIGHILLGHEHLEDASDYDHMKREMAAWREAAWIRGDLPFWTLLHVACNHKEKTGLDVSTVYRDVKRAAKEVGWTTIPRSIWSKMRKELKERFD